MYTKKNFIEFANMLKSLPEDSLEAKILIARFLCNIFHKSNPRFNAEKFIEYSGLIEHKEKIW